MVGRTTCAAALIGACSHAATQPWNRQVAGQAHPPPHPPSSSRLVQQVSWVAYTSRPFSTQPSPLARSISSMSQVRLSLEGRKHLNMPSGSAQAPWVVEGGRAGGRELAARALWRCRGTGGAPPPRLGHGLSGVAARVCSQQVAAHLFGLGGVPHARLGHGVAAVRLLGEDVLQLARAQAALVADGGHARGQRVVGDPAPVQRQAGVMRRLVGEQAPLDGAYPQRPGQAVLRAGPGQPLQPT
jgi:hypothetical protein